MNLIRYKMCIVPFGNWQYHQIQRVDFGWTVLVRRLLLASHSALSFCMEVSDTEKPLPAAFSAVLEKIHFFYTFCGLDTFSGNVGLAISQALILTGMVQYGILQATETMQQMTSVERILQYTDLEPVSRMRF